jgi:hypothetical protein
LNPNQELSGRFSVGFTEQVDARELVRGVSVSVKADESAAEMPASGLEDFGGAGAVGYEVPML